MKNSWMQDIQSLASKNQNPTISTLMNNFIQAADDRYRNHHSPEAAIVDMENICMIDPASNMYVSIYEDSHANNQKHVRIYTINNDLSLSDIMPVLHNFGLNTLHENRFHFNLEQEKSVYIIDLSVSYQNGYTHSFDEIKNSFENAIIQVIANGGENDGFNRLVIASNLDIDTINIIRSYAKYLKQIKYRYSQSFIEKTLESHVSITKKIIQLFTALHHPEQHDNQKASVIESEIISELEKVKNIDEDNIVRRIVLLCKATLRTNYFQLNSNSSRKNYITFKFDARQIPDMPQPVPLIDTFVYSSLFEGIHLRSHKVSRGGIRWSDRPDDYRSEVLGLMKAQKVKNSIIIPSGAKGGFIIKEKARIHEPDTKKCIISCYQQFIRGLLDITDNVKGDTVISPKNVVCRDGNDTYFVVAADKGTADLSDYANSLSNEYGFWLGDAFASGGSNGYDHKKLGITAKGAWESLKRNLQEINQLNKEFTMVGIGDMSGDVFGNGLIQSNKIKLIAAFDHRHIFIDPNPNPAESYNERVRLFNLKTSSWEDYNKDMISSGGGVYKRSEKFIAITPEVKSALSIEDDSLTPDQLIRAILKAKVDVLYNGGIGTYVKASRETSENVGDKYNEFCRVNGNELRCKIVCEGGNLGFTQLARVEYALRGGLINTDFIDNSAGVDCSDHEVNIKILLNVVAQQGKLSPKERSELLASMDQDVSNIVLKDNYLQALVMSYSSFHAKKYFDLYHDQIKELEELAGLDRTIEFLPTDEELSTRKTNGLALTKPELAVLLAYTKIFIKDEILKSELPDNPFFEPVLLTEFPEKINNLYQDAIKDHILKREIIATNISNDMVNTMGISYPIRLHNETGASISEIATAYYLSARIFNIDEIEKSIHALDGKIDVDLQYELLHAVRVLLNMSSRWFLQRRRLKQNLNEIIDYYSECIASLSDLIPTLIRGATKEYVTKMTSKFTEIGLDTKLAAKISVSRVLYTGLNIADVAAIHGFDLQQTALLYFHLGAVFNLVWFRDLLASDNHPGRRANMARLTLRDDLDALQRRLCIVILQSDPAEKNVDKLTANWIIDNPTVFTRWEAILEDCKESIPGDYSAMFIAIRELASMVDGTPKIEKLSLLAYHDALTKLPNRFAISDRLEQIKAKCDRDKAMFAIHFIDLNKFKLINDTYGHAVGDQVLLEVTRRLSSSIRSGDTVARQSGDEFVVIQSDVKSNHDALHMANTILSIISKPMYLGEHRLNVSASIGTAIYPMHGSNSIELVSNADKAMYESKSSGNGKAVVFAK